MAYYPIIGGYNATSGVYYMSLWSDGSDYYVAYDAGEVGQGFELNQTYGEWPVVISGETVRDYKASMFANYTDFVADTTIPTFTAITSNNTYAGQPTRLSCNVSDVSSVSHIIWSINNGSGYVNQSWTAFSSNPITFDFVANSTFRTNIKAKLYANDTLGNKVLLLNGA